MKPELGQGRMIFRFAPNCSKLEFDDKELRSSAAQQGYDAHFTTFKMVSEKYFPSPLNSMITYLS